MGTVVRPEALKYPSIMGPSVLKLSTDVVLEKGRVASQKRMERRKEVSDCVGQFDLAVKGFGPIVRRAHSVGDSPIDLVDPWREDSGYEFSKRSEFICTTMSGEKLFFLKKEVSGGT